MSEAKKSKQIQKSGNSSLNIQAEQITFGLAYQDVKAIALDVFKSNFYQLSDIAMDTAQKRAEEITNRFLDELMKKNPQGLKSAREPDFQYALFTVQKEYAKSGDNDLGSILVDILVDRTKEVNRNLMQIVLTESLQTAPKLTSNQYAALSVIFVLRYIKHLGMENFSDFCKYIGQMLSPFVPELIKEDSCYQHLVYAGCGTIESGDHSIEDILIDNYPILFVKPSQKKEMADFLRHKQNLSQLVPFTIRRQILSSREAKLYSIKAHPCMAILYDVWENSYMKNTLLTSVGIAIANANIRRVTGAQYDLSIWIK